MGSTVEILVERPGLYLLAGDGAVKNNYLYRDVF